MITITPFQWASDHIHLVGWPAVMAAAYKLHTIFLDVRDRAISLEAKANKLTENDIPHIQVSLESIDKNMAVLVALAQKK